ncbi:hypothetical protein BGI41_00455 [Methanobrevibacter sp. 87.7]|uniref:glycosyltransferase family 2 protein n=1 Tax=Methanobrevibacter sp. 87.7 TaxID=387957 RepID=UPI000B50E8EB|nr:glycosyltransferase [Methanobrevibacter sp. 87.7]OWT33821.1 hypothetical protein BGI41_00455 [Methanobrevibacter sp. 87.7]
MVKISVIIPVFNKEIYLRKSIDSVLNQTMKDLEIICINDGSTDNSLDILKEYEDKYEFIKVYSHENQGAGISRNEGIKIAKGEYIAFLDADDYYINKESLEKLYNTGKLNNANLVSGNIKIINSKGEVKTTSDSKYYKNNIIIKPEEYGIPWYFYKNIYKREFLISNNIYFPNLIIGEDSVFLAKSLSKLDCIYIVNIDLYGYCYKDNTNKSNNPKAVYDYVKQFECIFKYFKNPKFNKIKHDYEYKLFNFANRLSTKNKEIMLSAIKEIFKDNLNIIKRFEDYYYLKYSNNKKLMENLNITLEKPRISIIIPLYNTEKYLNENIDSILKQDFEDFEIIYVNDGSTDKSLEILESYKDKRIKIINQKNQGAAVARNTGLKHSNGEYIYFIDSDDYITPNTLKKLYENAIINDSEIVLYKIAKFNEDKIRYNAPGFDFEKKIKNINFKHYTFDYHKIKHYIFNDSFSPCNKLYKKEFLDSNNFYFKNGLIFEDVPFQIETMLKAEKMSYVPEYLYYYRSNPKSVMNKYENREDIYKIIDIVEEFLKENNYYNEVKYEFDYFKLLQISQYIIPANTEKYFKKAKKELEQVNINENKLVPKSKIKTYNMIINSNSLNEYKIKNYEKQIKILEKENKRLKNKNNLILNSNSWKITKFLRKIRNIRK